MNNTHKIVTTFLVGRGIFIAKILLLNSTYNSIQSLYTHLYSSNEPNFILNRAILNELFIIYYIFTNLTITRLQKTGLHRSSPVFCSFLIWKTGLGLGPCPGGSKEWTGPDFQTLNAQPPQRKENQSSSFSPENPSNKILLKSTCLHLCMPLHSCMKALTNKNMIHPYPMGMTPSSLQLIKHALRLAQALLILCAN